MISTSSQLPFVVARKRRQGKKRGARGNLYQEIAAIESASSNSRRTHCGADGDSHRSLGCRRLRCRGCGRACAKSESEGDLSGPWSVTVHHTTKEGLLDREETYDYKATITFVPTATAHYAASGHVNLAPKTDAERIYNIYFQSCARGEGHDIAKTSPQTYKCSYEHGEANRYADGTTTSTVYNGDLNFELNGGTLRGKTRFLIRFSQNGGPTATHSEEAEWTGARQPDRQDCATAQEDCRPS